MGALGALLIVSFVVCACAATARPVGSSPAGLSGSPASSPVAAPTGFSATDWASVTLPASSCDPAASGDIVLAAGTGTVRVDASTVYAVTLELPPDVGEIGGRPVAVLRYSCLLQGANGVGAFPLAVFVAGVNGPEPAGILQSTDLGVASSGSTLSLDAVSFLNGQIVLTGKYLTESDPRCCASGTGWTSIALLYGRLIPSGVVTAGAPPATLPSRGARVSGDLIGYDPPVPVQKQEDLGYLEGAPRDFTDFVWSLKQQTDGPGCASVISVARLRLNGFAAGSEGCDPPSGGAEMLWVKRSGHWEVLMQLQNTPGCAALTAAKFPADVLGDAPTCLDATGAEIPYTS